MSDGGSNNMTGRGGNSHVQTHEMLESQNEQMVDQMADKVKQLRSVSENDVIHTHTHTHTHQPTHTHTNPHAHTHKHTDLNRHW